MNFEILEDITSADVAFRAAGESIEELFSSAAYAVMSVMLDDTGAVNRNVHRDIAISGTEADLLLHSFLSEFVFYKDAESLLLFPEKIEIQYTGSGYELRCRTAGEVIDRRKHAFRIDVKAVTLHMLKVEHDSAGWSAIVVLDV